MAIHSRSNLRRAARCAFVLLAASAALCGPAAAQESLQTVVVTGRTDTLPASVSGFGDVPAARTPLALTGIRLSQLRDAGASELTAITSIDAGVGDAYNAEGYWGLFSVRGFVIDPRSNYRRDGLPINGETSLPLDNKQSVEILKGLSGMQSGVSSPGGLINLVVKRPAGRVRTATIDARQRGTVGAAVDLGDGAAEGNGFGWRVNAAAEHLDPQLRDARGERNLLALALDWRLASGTRVEIEGEHSHRSQPSQPGFSLLGDHAPDADAIDPRINLNNQPWSQPVVLDGDTATLRLTQRLTPDWSARLHIGLQRLRSDDRAAFPYGVYDSDTFDCSPCDRFAPDGTYTMWEYVSDNERRNTDAADLSLTGRVRVAGQDHALQIGVLRSRLRARFEDQVFDIAGTGNIAGTMVTPASPGTASPNTDRNEDSTELYLRDRWTLAAGSDLWIGLRRSRLSRSSVQTDGGSPVAYSQSFTTPWIAFSQAVGPHTIVYASWGQGVETQVAPNQPRYVDAGQPLPALKSRQVEAGLKGDGPEGSWSLVAFDVRQPQWSDFGTCDVDASCTRARDGDQRHRGVEGALNWRLGGVALHASAMALNARRENSADAANNGLRPTNVARRSVKAGAAYDFSALPGLTLMANMVNNGSRVAVPDNSVSVPGWTRWDLAAHYATVVSGHPFTLRVGVDNATDKRAWRESPYQFGHAYLYPLAPRTWWLAIHAEL